jgi:hypothetical protein
MLQDFRRFRHEMAENDANQPLLRGCNSSAQTVRRWNRTTRRRLSRVIEGRGKEIVMLTGIITRDGEAFTHNPLQRGYHAVYRQHEVNHCPGCGRTHWYVGRISAECGFCATALPLDGNGRRVFGWEPAAA